MNATMAYRILRLLVLLLAGFAAQGAHAAYSCNVVVTDGGVIYTVGANNREDVTGTVVITCTRDVATDANTLTYRIGADNGANYANPDRRARLGATNNYLDYTLARGTAVGGAATCSDTNTWGQIILTTNVMSGTLAFGTAATASATWGFCLRVRGNQGNPTAGSYTDAINVYAQYPATLFGAVATAATINYTIGARNQCVLRSFPNDMSFAYTSFRPTAQVITQTFQIECSNNLAWSVALAPTTGTLLGLNYTLTRSPTASTGTNAPQTITITGTMAANQRGTCNTSTCTASQAHTVTITY